jgi:phosphatidylglycerophosphatase C
MLPGVQVQSADDVWARITQAAGQHGGGVLATDADGTLWTGDVGEDLFHAFVEHGVVHEPAALAMAREARDHALSDAGTPLDVARRLYAAYADHTYPEQRACELMAWCFAGWTRAALAEFARAIAGKLGLEGRMHGEVMGLLARARKAGLEVILVSASPIAIVTAAGSYAGFDEAHVVAARSLWDGDVMLPDVDRPIPYAGGKVQRLREHIGPDRPLYAALGDNGFDVALLASARVGIAVRPKPRLRERAAEVPGLVELARSS